MQQEVFQKFLNKLKKIPISFDLTFHMKVKPRIKYDGKVYDYACLFREEGKEKILEDFKDIEDISAFFQQFPLFNMDMDNMKLKENPLFDMKTAKVKWEDKEWNCIFLNFKEEQKQ